ncbi:MAG: ABC transporter substrate-binding protein [Clostridiales bacterium]
MNKKLFLPVLILIFSLSLLMFSGCNKDTKQDEANQPPNGAKQKVTVVLDWTPNTNHTGLYVAQAEGFFAEQGLDVEIVQPADNVATQLVAAGKADFGISYQEEVTFARTEGVPIISIAAIIQHNTSCFSSPVDRNIKSIKDFAGKRYGGWGGEVENGLLKYLEAKEGMTKPVENINIGSSDFFAATANKTIDFSWIFYGWTGIEAEGRNIKLDSIFLKDIDPNLDYYTPVIIASEDFLQKNGDLSKKFMTAVSQGYQFCAENPDKAADILLAADSTLPKELVKNSQAWLASKYIDDAPQWGLQKEEIWQNYSQWLMDNGLLEKGFDVKAAFTNDYLPQK